MVVSFGLTLILQSSGIIYSKFLATVVGGLPRQADEALPVIREATLNAGAFEYEAVSTAGFSDSLPAIDNTGAVDTNAEVTMGLKGQEDVSKLYTIFDTEITSIYLPSYSYLKGQLVKNNSTVDVFLDLILATDNPWREMKSTVFESKAVSVPFTSLELTNILDKAQNGGSLVGRSQIPATTGTADANAGAAALVYQYPLKGLVDSQDAPISDSRLTLWVSKKNGQVMLYQTDVLVTTAAGNLLVTTQVRPTSYGGVEVKGIPAEAEVISGSLEDYYPMLGIAAAEAPGVDEPTTIEPVNPTEPNNPETPAEPVPTTTDLTTTVGRDAQRLTDLTAIKKALDNYHTAKGSYPVSTTVDQTNASTVLKNALVPNYLSILPVDPNNSQYWYGYTSDGFSFTLTSVLEDTASAGKQGDNVRYQEVTN